MPAATTEPLVAPRKRGRPPKPGGPAPPKPVVLDASGQPRKRGRPRKEPHELKTKKPQPAADPDAPKRARGRPKKTAVATTTAKTTPAAAGKPKPKPKTKAKAKAKPKSNGTSNTSAGNTHSSLQKFIGTYTLECPAVEEEWSDLVEDMELTITPSSSANGLIASFNMGILEGTMLLAADKKTLDEFHAKMNKGELDSDEDDSENEPPAKKSKTASGPDSTDNLRLYFIWRGRETSEGEIHSGSTGGNEGTIEFHDEKAIQFKGLGSFPALGNKCHFTGTKFDNDTPKAPEPWSAFSDEAAEQARVSRWN